MITLRDLVLVVEERSVFPTHYKTLVSKDILQTCLWPSEYALLSLSDTELINRLKTPLLTYLLQTNNIHKVTRLTVIYDSLNYLQEAEDYLLSQPKSSISFLASLPISSLMVNLAKETTTKLPSELWREVIGKLESKRDISALTSTKSGMKREKEEYIANHQYSILKGNTGETQYYNNYFLTKFKVEMLDMMYKNYMKSIDTNEYMNDKYNIPDYDNQLVISIIFAIELAKYYEQPAVIDLRSINGIDFALEDIISPEDYVINNNIVVVTVKSVAGNLVKVIISNNIEVNTSDTLIISINKYIPQAYVLTNHCINIFPSWSNLKSYEEAEVTPVWVKIVSLDQVQATKGRNLILQGFGMPYPNKDKLNQQSVIMSLQGSTSGIVWNVLKDFENIIVMIGKDLHREKIQEIYSVLSQHSTYPRNLIIVHGKDVYMTYIPFPRKLISEMHEESGLYTNNLTFDINRPSYCGLTYVEMLVATFHPLKYQDVNTRPRPEADTIYNWVDSKIANRVISYTLPAKRGSTRSSLNGGYWKLERTDNQTKEDCWILMDPNQLISDKPLIK